MKNIFAIFLAVAYCMVNSSCSVVGLYTKQQAIKKFCRQDSAKLDTIIKIDTLITDSGESFKFKLDCANLQAQYDSLKNITNTKDKLLDSLGYALLYSDSIFDLYYKHQGKQGTNFILKPKERKIPTTLQVPIKIKIPCNCPPCPQPPEPTFWQKLKMDIIDGFALLGLTAFIAGILLLIFRKR